MLYPNVPTDNVIGSRGIRSREGRVPFGCAAPGNYALREPSDPSKWTASIAVDRVRYGFCSVPSVLIVSSRRQF